MQVRNNHSTLRTRQQPLAASYRHLTISGTVERMDPTCEITWILEFEFFGNCADFNVNDCIPVLMALGGEKASYIMLRGTLQTMFRCVSNIKVESVKTSNG